MSTRQRTSTKSGFRVPLKEGKATPTIHPRSAGGGWGHYRTQFIENKKENPKRLARFSFFSLSQSPQHNATCSQKAQQSQLIARARRIIHPLVSPRTTPPATAARRREARPQQRKLRPEPDT